MEAAGLPLPTEKPFDGRSLLSVLHGKTKTVHEHLFWSEGGSSGEWAVLSGNWKLVAIQDQRQLFNLAEDPSEERDLAAQKPGKVAELTRLYDAWLDQMAEPMKSGAKRWKQEKLQERELTDRQKKRLDRRNSRKGNKKAD